MRDEQVRDVAWLLLAAFVVRLSALAVAGLTGRFPEFWEYETIARHILAGDGFVYESMGLRRWAYVEPVYPLFVTLVYLIAGFRPTVLAVVQCAVAAAIAPVVYAFARRTFGRPSAFAAGALVAVHPALAGYATKLHPLTFDALAIALVALTLVRLLTTPDHRGAVAFGLATGVCILTRPTIGAFIGAVVVWLSLSRLRRPAFVSVILGLAIASAVVAPWVIRNYIRTDGFVLTRSHVGFNFWLGNHPGATGGEGDPTDPTGARSLFDRAAPELRERVLSQPDEIRQDRVFWSEVLEHISRDPLAFAGRTIRKLAYYWWFPPYVGRRYGTAATLVYGTFYVSVLALAILGLARSWRRPEPGQGDGIRVLLLILATIAVAQSFFYVQGRHRLGVEALLMVLSGHGLAWLFISARGDRRPEPT